MQSTAEPDRPLLHERFPSLRATLPHLSLSDGFSPVRRLSKLSQGQAPVWLKDDGTFGSGPWGGNKVRKLEWILPDVRRRGARTILTVGGLGTNWGLATALYAREQGLDTALALVDQPLDEHVRRQLTRLERSGASLHFTRSKGRTIAIAPWLLLRYTRRRPPYVLPPGGSSPLGALGYVEAAFEIARQVELGALPEPSHIVVAMGSGGTVAGLVLGLELTGLQTRVVGVPVTDQLRLDAGSTARLARRAEKLLVRRGAEFAPAQIGVGALTVLEGWVGPGYGHPTIEAERAIAIAAEREGLGLEPVYTAKAFAALLSENEAGRFEGPILYLHTDGPR